MLRDATAQDEAALIARVQAGDKELFCELVRPHQRRVYAAALAILRNEADAEEVAQEGSKGPGSPGKFSKGIEIQHLADSNRRQRGAYAAAKKSSTENYLLEEQQGEDREEGAYRPKDFADWREIPSEALDRKEIRAALLRALASLAEKYREVFVLRDVESLSIEETASILGITAGSVKTRLLRARLMLRDF